MDKKLHRRSLNAENGAYDLYTASDDCKYTTLQRLIFAEKQYHSMPVYCSQLSESVLDGYRWVKHVNFPYLVFELHLEGKMQYLSDNKLDITEPGSLYVITPGSSVSFSSFPGTPAHRIVMLIKGNNLNSITSTLRLNQDCCVKVEKYEELAEKLRQFTKLSPNDAEAVYTNSIMTYKLILEISRMIPRTIAPEREVLKAIEEKFSINISINRLCSQYGISPASLWRFFKKEFGISPMEYLVDLRLKKGLDILRNTDLSIRAIARNCGIPDASRFCALFKKKYGSTPEVFRNYLKEQEKHYNVPGKK